jgi:hypothetical protein
VSRYVRNSVNRGDCVDLATEISDYFVFSLFPFFLVMAALVGWFPSPILWHSFTQCVVAYFPGLSQSLVFSTLRDLGNVYAGVMSFWLVGTIWSASSEPHERSHHRTGKKGTPSVIDKKGASCDARSSSFLSHQFRLPDRRAMAGSILFRLFSADSGLRDQVEDFLLSPNKAPDFARSWSRQLFLAGGAARLELAFARNGCGARFCGRNGRFEPVCPLQPPVAANVGNLRRFHHPNGVDLHRNPRSAGWCGSRFSSQRVRGRQT